MIKAIKIQDIGLFL